MSPHKTLYPNPILDSRNFTDETYILLSRTCDVIKENKLKNGHCKKPESRETFSKLFGITSSAAKKAICISNSLLETFKKKCIGRPPHELEKDYILAVKNIVKDFNEKDLPATVKTIKKALKDKYDIGLLRQALLRDMHTLKLRYKQGIRRDLNHDSDANIEYTFWFLYPVLLQATLDCSVKIRL